MKERAIQWWKRLDQPQKNSYCSLVINPKRSYRSLSDNEILKIYEWTCK